MLALQECNGRTPSCKTRVTNLRGMQVKRRCNLPSICTLPASLRNVNVEIGDSLHHTDAAGKTFVFVLTLLCKSILDWNLALSGLHAVLSLMKFHYEDFCRSALLPLNLFAMNSLNAVIFCIGRVHALYSIGLT